MSQDTHTGNSKETEIKKSKTSYSSSFWFIIILIVLFVSAINFVKVMSNSDEGEKKEQQKTESPAVTGKDTPAETHTTDAGNSAQASSDTPHK